MSSVWFIPKDFDPCKVLSYQNQNPTQHSHIGISAFFFFFFFNNNLSQSQLYRSPGAQSLRLCLSQSTSPPLHALLTFSPSLTHASTVPSLPYPSANPLSSTPQSEPPPLRISIPPPPPPRRSFTLLTALPPSNQRRDPSSPPPQFRRRRRE